MTDILSSLSGVVVGLVLGLVGGGGSIIAVPLLLYAVGVASPHVAIGTSAIAVSLSAFANLLGHARNGKVKWPCAISFSAAGIIGAWAGSTLAMRVPGENLLAMFGVLMVAVGGVMLMRKDAEGNPGVRLNFKTARQLLPLLFGIGFAVGMLSGFFGIGGGFLIVPGLMLATGMPIAHAIGTSLTAVTAFGAATALNYAYSGLVNWRIAAFFIAGGVAGGIAGRLLGGWIGASKGALAMVFAAFVILVGLYVTARSLGLLPA